MRDVPEPEAIQALVLKLGNTIWRVGIGIGSWPGATTKWTRGSTLAEDKII